MIEVQEVTKSYGAAVVVDRVSLSVPRGGMVALVGANGAGKSTLLSMMSRLAAPTSGRIVVDGLDVAEASGRDLARRLAILRQDTTVPARLTVQDLVAFGRFPHSRGRLTDRDRAPMERALAAMELEAIRHRFLDEISGGQRQRAFIAMVLCQDTDYVLLDEPLNNLDIKHAAAMMGVFRRLVEEMGKTVLVVLHDINVASCHADRIVALRDGRVIHDGPPAEVVRRAVIRDIYGLDAPVHDLEGHRVVFYFR
jgi:iron complex transport system ATP-binding protein